MHHRALILGRVNDHVNEAVGNHGNGLLLRSNGIEWCNRAPDPLDIRPPIEWMTRCQGRVIEWAFLFFGSFSLLLLLLWFTFHACSSLHTTTNRPSLFQTPNTTHHPVLLVLRFITLFVMAVTTEQPTVDATKVAEHPTVEKELVEDNKVMSILSLMHEWIIQWCVIGVCRKPAIQDYSRSAHHVFRKRWQGVSI